MLGCTAGFANNHAVTHLLTLIPHFNTAPAARPFDDAKVTNTTGAWYWVGVPKSVLINGKGRYEDW
jgi:hypothetical protein